MTLCDLHKQSEDYPIIIEMDKTFGGADLQRNWILRKRFTWILLSLRPLRGDTRVANMEFREKVPKLLQI